MKQITYYNKNFPLLLSQYLCVNKLCFSILNDEIINFKFLIEIGAVKSNPNPANEKEQLWHKKLLMEKRSLMLTLIVAAFLLISGIIVASTYFLVHDDIITGPNDTPGDGDDYRQNIPINSTIGIWKFNQNFIVYAF